MVAPATPTDSPPGRRRWLRGLAYAIGSVAALMAIAWIAVPPIARWQLETRLSELLDRPTTVESVAFDPFRLRLTVRRLAIADRTLPAPLLAVDELVANLSTASIWNWAPVLDALKVVRPNLMLARDTAGRYNVQDLIDRAMAAPPGPPPRLSLNNIEIEEGTVAFDDAITGRKHLLTGLDVGIPFVSTVPHDAEVLVTPRVSGALNNARFALTGSTLPFADRREATIDVTLDALPLPAYVGYLPAKPRVVIAGGNLTTRLAIVFVDAKSGERRLELRGEGRLDGLAIKRHDGTPLAAAERIAVTLDRVDALAHDARLAAVAIDAPNVELKRLADGTLELAHPLFEPAPASPAAGKPTIEPGWTASIARLTVARGALALSDESTAFRSELADVTLDATNVSTRPGERAHVKTAFVSADRIATFSAEADVEPMVPAASGRFALTKFSLGLLFPYYKSALAVDVQKGSLDYASTFALDAAGALQLSEGEASITDLRLALSGNRDPLWRVPALAARGIAVDVPARKLVLGEVEIRDAALRLVREADGSLEMSRLVMKTTEHAGSAPDEATWTLLIRKLAFDRLAVDFEDRALQPPARIALRELKANISDFTNARGVNSGVALRANVGDRGRVAFNGTFVNNPLAASGQLDARALSLVALKPYIEPQVNVVLTDGRLAAKGRVTVETREGAAPRATWKGDLAVSDFAALDRPTSSDLARWKSLALEGVDVATDPFRAAVARIAFSDFFARVIIYQDASLNFARLLTPGASPEPAPDAKPSPAATAAAGTETRRPISIGRIEFVRGNVNISDFFIQPNYSANLTDVGGSVTTMSAEQAGDVMIEARVEHTAPVEVQGRVNPFAPQLSLDLRGKARDVDLPPLTAYSAKYAGYGIEKGKLTFDVHYRIEDRKLAAENRLVLDQLTFGPRVESPSATKLPVLLAVALLKDSRGVIDIRLPISGSLDDPKFSIGGLIIQVIVNLIGKAVTAPFTLLAAAFGGGEELSTLEFAAGSAALDAESQKRVDTLAKALADRPALKLDIAGRADPVADREAMRRAAVETALRREKMKSLAAAGSAPPSLEQVAIGAEERNRWLTAAYREAPLPDRPRNVIGMLKELPPAEMEAMLYANAKVDDQALRALANARAEAVKDAIAAKGVPPDRLFLVAPRLGGEPASAAAAGKAPAQSMRVDLALR
jgi:uncharacterized protein involved in outer membrane biogenesis